MTVTPDKQRNIEHARKAIEEAVEKGAQLVVLPVSLWILKIIVSLVYFKFSWSDFVVLGLLFCL